MNSQVIEEDNFWDNNPPRLFAMAIAKVAKLNVDDKIYDFSA